MDAPIPCCQTKPHTVYNSVSRGVRWGCAAGEQSGWETMPRVACVRRTLFSPRPSENRRPPPCTPRTLPPSSGRRRQSPPRRGHSPPAGRSAGAAPLRPAPGSQARGWGRSRGPRRAAVSCRAESRRPRTFSGALRATQKYIYIKNNNNKTKKTTESGSSPSVRGCGRGGRRCPEPALSARPEPSAAASPRRAPDGVAGCPRAGPSPSSSRQRAELRPRPRPLPGLLAAASPGL